MSNPDLTPSSANGGDWEAPTTVAQRLGDAVQLLCNGKRPPEAMVVGWLDHSSEELQSFCADHGPAWAQGIGLIDAAMVMVDQPTEITTPEHQDRDHEHLAPTEAAAMAATVPAEPVYWEFRWKDTHPQTVTSGQWYPWEKVEPRNGSLETVESRLAELRYYIAQGKCYELRALYTQAPVAGQPAEPSPADPIRGLLQAHEDLIEQGENYAYFELAYTRRTGWMAWLTDRPASGEPGTAEYAKSRKVIAQGQGDSAEEACQDALDVMAAPKGDSNG